MQHSQPKQNTKGFAQILSLVAIALLVGLGVYSYTKFNEPKLGASIQTNLSDTINTFRTNVNTSLSNLDASVAAITSTQAGYGNLIGINSPLPVVNGGTGTTTVPSNAQFLAASGTIPTWKTLLGSGVIITNSPTSTTITATAVSAGTTTNIQYNAGGQLDATSSFAYTSSTHVLVTAGTATPSAPGTFATATLTFSFTGAVASWTVPGTATSVIISVRGAAGGNGISGSSATGFGGAVTGTLAVTPGTVYWLNVGQSPATSTGGYGGGGNGGSGNGSGGGGMSWFSTASTFSTSSVIAVGGGGGGDRETNSSSGGKAGGLTGSQGSVGGCAAGAGGGGGTQSAGGSAGTACVPNGNAGTEGQGGNGAAGGDGVHNGGGGGGGYFGGGGGAANNITGDGAGGGGSSFTALSLTATSTGATSTGNGLITLSFSGAPSVVGNNNVGTVTENVAVTSTQINFANNPFALAQGVSCNFTMNNATNTWIASSTKQGFTIVFTNTVAQNQSFNYFCLPY